jgi:hypothetical protein
MVNAADYIDTLVEYTKYRVVTEYTDEILVYRGLGHNDNPLFVRDVFPVMLIPWPAIVSLIPVKPDLIRSNKKSGED